MQGKLWKVDVDPNVVWILQSEKATLPCMRRGCQTLITRDVVTAWRLQPGVSNVETHVSLTEPSLFSYCDAHTRGRVVSVPWPIPEQFREEFEQNCSSALTAACAGTELSPYIAHDALVARGQAEQAS